MLIAHRIALDPTNAQRTYFARASGTARFAWNWALAEWQRQYVLRKDDPSLPTPTDASLRRQLNGLKREEFPWMFDVTSARRKRPSPARRRIRPCSRVCVVPAGRYRASARAHPTGARSGPNWRCRSDCSIAMNVDTRPGGISTLPGISNTWPRASRSQLMERNALARGTSPA